MAGAEGYVPLLLNIAGAHTSMYQPLQHGLTSDNHCSSRLRLLQPMYGSQATKKKEQQESSLQWCSQCKAKETEKGVGSEPALQAETDGQVAEQHTQSWLTVILIS